MNTFFDFLKMENERGCAKSGKFLDPYFLSKILIQLYGVCKIKDHHRTSKARHCWSGSVKKSSSASRWIVVWQTSVEHQRSTQIFIVVCVADAFCWLDQLHNARYVAINSSHRGCGNQCCISFPRNTTSFCDPDTFSASQSDVSLPYNKKFTYVHAW